MVFEEVAEIEGTAFTYDQVTGIITFQEEGEYEITYGFYTEAANTPQGVRPEFRAVFVDSGIPIPQSAAAGTGFPVGMTLDEFNAITALTTMDFIVEIPGGGATSVAIQNITAGGVSVALDAPEGTVAAVAAFIVVKKVG